MDSIAIDDLKQAAAGRWPEILQSLCNWPADLLDGRNHPCPMCGGVDRFRFTDLDGNGSCFCNQCHKNGGDGLASLMWAKNITFAEAVQFVAVYLGVTRTANSPPGDLLAKVCQLKRMPIESARAYGAHVAKRGKLDVVRFPVVNEEGAIHSHFDLSGDGGKGWFRKGKGSAGLFLPIVDGNPRLSRDEVRAGRNRVYDRAAERALLLSSV